MSAFLRNTTTVASCWVVRNISLRRSSMAMPKVPCGVLSARIGAESPVLPCLNTTSVSTVSLFGAQMSPDAASTWTPDSNSISVLSPLSTRLGAVIALEAVLSRRLYAST